MAKPNRKEIKEFTESVKKAEEAINNFAKTFEKETKRASKELKDHEKVVKQTQDDYEDLANTVKKLNIERGLSIRHVMEYSTQVVSLGKELKNIEKMSKRAMNEDDYKNVIREARLLEVQIEEITEKIDTLGASSAEAFMDMGGGLKKFGNLWGAIKGGPSSIRGWSKGAQEYSDRLKKWPDHVAKTGKAMKLLGGTVGKLGGMLGGVGKLLAGWPGLILGAGKMLIDFTMKVDRVVKDANKAFAMIRGPDIMTRDIRKQFQEFNNQIYKAGENIQVGLNVDQIRNFMQAVYQAGQNITMLNSSLMTYRDVIHTASKASKILSMDIEQIGATIGIMLTDFKADMESIDEAFVQVAFDARKSGLSTDRFWNAVTNASASLSFFGLYLKDASKLMKKLTDTQVMGAKETEEMVVDLTQSFVKMDKDQRMAFARLLKNIPGATEAVRQMFKDLEEEFKYKRESIELKVKDLAIKIERAEEAGRLDEVTNLTEEQNKLLAQLSDIDKDIEKAQRAQTGDIFAMANYLPMLSGQAGELIAMLADRFGGLSNLSERGVRILEEVFKILGLNTDLAQKMRDMAEVTRNTLLRQLGINKDDVKYTKSIIAQLELGNKLNKVQQDELSSAFEKLRGNVKGDELLEAQQNLQKILMQQGWDEEAAKNAARIAGINSEFSQLLEEYIKTNKKMGKNEIDALKKSYATEKTIRKVLFGTKESEERTGRQLEDQAEDTFKKIIDQTLPLEEMVKMAKDEAWYRGASLTQIDRISGFVSDILGLMKKDRGIEETTSQMAFRKELERITGLDLMQRKQQTELVTKTIMSRLGTLENLKYLRPLPDLLAKPDLQPADLEKEIDKLVAAGYDTNHPVIKTLKRGYEELVNGNVEGLTDIRAGIDEELSKEEKRLRDEDQKLHLLEGMNEGNKKLRRALEAGIRKGEEGGLDELADLLITELRGEKFKGIYDLMKRASEIMGTTLTEEDIEKIFKKREYEIIYKAGTGITIEKMKREQGLTEPMTISTAEMPIMAHRGETLLPAPGAGGRGPGAGAAPGAGVIYNITAVSKDLVTAREVGNMIVNQIRASKYKEQLTGAA